MSVRLTTSASSDRRFATAKQIDDICLAFEDAWLRGETPPLEAFASQLSGDASSAAELVTALLAVEFVYRRRRGETPQAEAYVARLPQFAAEIEAVFTAEVGTCGPVPDLTEGSLLGRYRLQRELGRGAFGRVFLAEDEQLRRPVAIKVAGNGALVSREQAARLLEEARAAAGLRHPGLVAIHDVQPLSSGSIFVVQEYVAGGTLRASLAQPRTARHLAELFARIADAIAYAHAQGFVHRDLDPENVLLDGEGQPRIADFGLALRLDEQARWAGERAGSWAYMSPEQVRGEAHRLDGRSDIWALGVMLYEALAGRRPFRGDTRDELADEILHRAPRPPRQFVRGVSAELERICLKCLAKAPEERFPTAGDVAQALRRAGTPGPARLSRRALLLGGPLGLCGAWLAWRQTRFAEPPPPARESLELRVWKHRAWRSLAQLGTLPLRHGDQLRLTVSCHPARYAYLVWVDSRGQPAPVYPWRQGLWTDLPQESSLVEELHLPSDDPDAVWTMETPHRGCELLLLLTREEPWSAAAGSAAWFGDLPLAVDLPPDVSIRMTYDRFEPLERSDRSVNTQAVSRLEDPLLRLQNELRRRFRETFPRAEFLLVPVASS